MQSDDGTTKMLYPSKFYDKNRNTGAITDYVYADDQLVATVDANGTHYVHADHLTGSNIITDSFPKEEQLLDYYPFGDIRINEKLTGLDVAKKYTGHYYDTDSDLNYMGARYYQAKRGQFMSEDPVFWGIGTSDSTKFLMDPQALNSYSYSRNNPLRYIDPDGRTFLEMVGNTISSLGANIVNAAAGIVNGVFHLAETGKAIGNSISNLPQTISNLPMNAKETYNNFQNASDSEKGQMLGSGIFFAGSIALPELRAGTLSEGALVCRGGLCTADRFVNGAEKIGADGKLYGISVNAGDASISDLTKSLPQNKVGVGALEKIKSMGGEFVSMPKSGNPYYGQLNGLTGEQLESVFGKNVISNPNK